MKGIKMTDTEELNAIRDYLWPNQTGLPNEHRNCLVAIKARERLSTKSNDGGQAAAVYSRECYKLRGELLAAEAKLAEMRAWWASSIQYIWQNETREVTWDWTMVMGKGYDWFGWEHQKWELILPWAKYAVWPHCNSFAVYGGADGCFNGEQLTQEDAMKLAEEWALSELGHSTPAAGWISHEEGRKMREELACVAHTKDEFSKALEAYEEQVEGIWVKGIDPIKLDVPITTLPENQGSYSAAMDREEKRNKGV